MGVSVGCGDMVSPICVILGMRILVPDNLQSSTHSYSKGHFRNNNVRKNLHLILLTLQIPTVKAIFETTFGRKNLHLILQYS